MSKARSMLSRAAYRLVFLGLRWGKRGAALLERSPRRGSSTPPGGTARITFRVMRVSSLPPLARARTWLRIAWTHTWQTNWAAFDWYVSAEASGRQVCLAGIVARQGAIGGIPTRLGLLGGVLTVPEYRNKGLASEVVRRSVKLMADELGCDYGLLQCGDTLVPFYERLGWKVVANIMTFERSGEHGVVTSNVMAYECGGRPIPAGMIDLKGLPA